MAVGFGGFGATVALAGAVFVQGALRFGSVTPSVACPSSYSEACLLKRIVFLLLVRPEVDAVDVFRQLW